MELTKDELAVLRYVCQHPDSTIEESCQILAIDAIEINTIDSALLSQGLVTVSLIKYRKTNEGYIKMRLYQVTETGKRVARIAVS